MSALLVRPRRQPWWGLVALMGVVLAGALAVRGGGGSRIDVVVIPPEHHVEPQLLSDGTPVWVRTTPEGIEVLDAFTPPPPGAAATPGQGMVGSAVGWCASGERWVDPHRGLTFAPAGARYAGIVPGRQHGEEPPVGLSHRQVTPAGEGGAGDPARVSAAITGPAGVTDPPLAGERGHGPPPECRLAVRRLDPIADPRGPDAVALTGLVDHGILATPLVRDRDGWQVVTGWVVVGPGSRARWCARGQVGSGATARCEGGTGVVVDLGLGEDDVGPVATSIGAPLLVRVDGGRIVAAAVLPSSSWAGSSLGGTRTVRLSLIGRDRTGSRLLVRSAAEVRCLSPAPQMAGAPEGTQAVYVDSDTDVQVGGAISVEGLANLGMNASEEVPGVAVEVVLDEVTCRALAVLTPG